MTEPVIGPDPTNWEWRVGGHYGVHVYGLNPDQEQDDEPVASFMGAYAQRLAKRSVDDHNAQLNQP